MSGACEFGTVRGEIYLNIKAYLERINYTGSLAPTAETLRELQVAHLLAVPFENLSIHAKEPVVLEDEALFTKIVERRRGGFCYEANGLFAALLRELGFDVVMLSAGVANAEGGFGPDFDHMTLMVTLDERWLVDVGFGDSFLEPLLLDKRSEQVQGERAYRIVDDGDHLILTQRDNGEEWEAQYRFTLQPHEYADYAEMCRYHQTSPQSHFTRSRVCSRATHEGRITLSEMRLITTSNSGGRQERTLTSQEEYAAMLREHFGIEMRS
jgi:N-hydroxyarylamine O-acetyltransferase